MSGSLSKKISPDKKFYVERDGALLNVFSRATDTPIHSIALPQYNLRKPEIFRWSANSKAVGIFIALGIPYDAGGYQSVRTNYRIGIWYPFQDEFYTVHFPDQNELESNHEPIDSIRVLADERIVICSLKGQELKRVEMPKEPLLSNWEKAKRDLEIARTNPFDPDKKEWIWNENQSGYEGVHLYEGQVLWFSHSHNPHSGGAASGQSFEDFLENGAACAIPDEFLPELYAVVKYLVSQKNK